MRDGGLRIGMGLWAAAAAIAAASVGAATPLEQQIRVCQRVVDEVARLACFDAIRLPEAPGVVPEPEAETQAAGSSAHERRFGGEFLPKPDADDRSGEVREISAVIDDLERRPFGEYLFRLSNGQVWTELEPGRRRYRTGMSVTIERTPLGGYVLSAEGGRSSRVRRIE